MFPLRIPLRILHIIPIIPTLSLLYLIHVHNPLNVQYMLVTMPSAHPCVEGQGSLACLPVLAS